MTELRERHSLVRTEIAHYGQTMYRLELFQDLTNESYFAALYQGFHDAWKYDNFAAVNNVTERSHIKAAEVAWDLFLKDRKPN